MSLPRMPESRLRPRIVRNPPDPSTSAAQRQHNPAFMPEPYPDNPLPTHCQMRSPSTAHPSGPHTTRGAPRLLTSGPLPPPALLWGAGTCTPTAAACWPHQSPPAVPAPTPPSAGVGRGGGGGSQRGQGVSSLGGDIMAAWGRVSRHVYGSVCSLPSPRTHPASCLLQVTPTETRTRAPSFPLAPVCRAGTPPHPPAPQSTPNRQLPTPAKNVPA